MNEKEVLAIDAGALLTPGRKLSPGRLIIEGTTIAEAGPPGTVRIPSCAQRLDASGLIVTPGFIDPHIHGCGGVDVMEATFDSLNVVSRRLVRHGTTSFLPTTVSSPPDLLGITLKRLGALIGGAFEGAQPLGIHMEGPFINPIRRGAHKAENILDADAALLEKWVRASANTIRLLTIAPERDGIDNVIRMAADFGITVAMGHSNASFAEASHAAGHGVCYAVHTFNAMREWSHRDPGITGAVLSDDRIFAEIIADGLHVDPSAVRLFARAKGKERVLIVTDAISAAGMPDGSYALGTDTIHVANGACRDAEGRLAGSTLTQDVALRNFVQWTGFPFEEALLGLTVNPARALKLDRKGVLEAGADADIAILDRDLRVVKAFVGGRLVWTN